MKIPLPCRFGEIIDYKRNHLVFTGLTWFQWTKGMEYTYFFSGTDHWHNIHFFTTFQQEQPYYIEIPDNLLQNTYIKDRGYPLTGRGYAYGIFFENDKTYMDFIITSRYMEHIKVQCDEKGICVQNGDIIFPRNWDNDEKKDRAILKSWKNM